MFFWSFAKSGCQEISPSTYIWDLVVFVGQPISITLEKECGRNQKEYFSTEVGEKQSGGQLCWHVTPNGHTPVLLSADPPSAWIFASPSLTPPPSHQVFSVLSWSRDLLQPESSRIINPFFKQPVFPSILSPGYVCVNNTRARTHHSKYPIATTHELCSTNLDNKGFVGWKEHVYKYTHTYIHTYTRTYTHTYMFTE